jgi:hypothetical protein
MAVGIPMKTTYANGDVLSASDINDITGTINLIGYGAPVVAGKNAVINGGMDVWQRGTSSSGNAYICDRWYSALLSGTGTFAQESTVVPSGSLYSQKFTASATAQPALYQAIETLNAIRLAGQTAVVSAKVAASTTVGFTIDVQHSSSTDNGVTGSWTSITPTSGGTASATSTTFVSISGVYAIPSTAKSLRVRLFTTSTIANGVVVYFDQVQLEQGTTATAFSLSAGTIAGELAACQRYTYNPMFLTTTANKPTVAGYSTTTTLVRADIVLPVTMRVEPSLTVTAADFAVGYSSGANGTISAISIVVASASNVLIDCTTSAITQDVLYVLYRPGTTQTMILSAEL